MQTWVDEMEKAPWRRWNGSWDHKMTQTKEQRSRETIRSQQKQSVLRSRQWDPNCESGAPSPHPKSAHNCMCDLGQVFSLLCASVSPCAMRRLLGALLGCSWSPALHAHSLLLVLHLRKCDRDTFQSASRKLQFVLVYPGSWGPRILIPALLRTPYVTSDH